MDFKNFRLGLIVRAVLLGCALFITIFAFSKYEWYVTSAVALITSTLCLVEIIRYAEKYKRSLTDFLLSIKSRDFISSTSRISDSETKDLLKNAYQSILTEFQNIRIDKEIQYHYLKTLVEHIKTALFSFNEEGKIEFINNTASDLLGIYANQSIKKIESKNSKIFALISKLKSGESDLIKIKLNDELHHFSVYASEIKFQNKVIKLISLQNIKLELEYQELESWQKLIRVLTHEIMNSVTPISSLSEAINETLEETNGDINNILKISNNDFDDIISSLKTIENRSKGLLRFVSSYKKLTRLPKPDFNELDLVELLNHCQTLLKPKFTENNIRVNFNNTNQEHICIADYDQIEQVIINVLINAIEAVKNQTNPKIGISITQVEQGKQQIIISDNGKGINEEELEKIFIPFFTTKKEGSGIGLSLSQQILRLHKGSITVNSEKNKGTDFIIML